MDYYGLKNQPFGSAPNADFYCDLPQQHGLADSIVSSLHEGESCIKITGNAGVGKTLLMKRIINNLNDDFYICNIISPDFDADGLRCAIAEALGLSTYNISQLRLLAKINDKLVEIANSGKKTILFIDDAELLHDSAIEAIRIITNFEYRNTKLIQLVVFAQHSFDQRLYSQQFSQVLQRFNKSLALCTLNLKDMDLYLCHRLVMAGHPTGQLFTVAAKKRLYKLTKGVPRLINVLCSKSLLISYQRGLPYVDVNEVQDSLNDCGELLYNSNNNSSNTFSQNIFVSIILCSVVVLLAIAYNIVMLGHR